MSSEPSLPMLARRTLQNLAATLRDAIVAPWAGRVPREWVVLRLDRSLSETRSTSAWLEGALQRSSTLADALDCLYALGQDPAVKGVLLRLGSARLGWAKVSALARAIESVRASGTKVVAFAESTGNAGAWLGALADHFWMVPEGRIDLLGVRIETPFVRDALEKLNIQPHVISAGRYKSAGEMVERSSMSRDSREALEEVVEDLYGSLLEGLARRAGGPDGAREWVDGGPYLASQAQQMGLVDELVYGDELPARLASLTDGPEAAGEEREARLITAGMYLRLARRRFTWPSVRKPRQLAVVPITGMIRPGSGSPRGVVGLLRRLARDDDVAAVVLRIDSPGGDPLASDLIWRAVGKLSEKKPVIASMGDTAASGGYYVAMGATEILAEANTLTGSIGVVMASLELEGLLSRLGVRFDAVERGRHVRIYDPVRSRTEEERALLKRQITQLYENFVGKAAAGRGIPQAELEKVAQGRVWTGAQAQARKLIDGLGDLRTALSRARELGGMAPDEGRVVHHSLGPGWLGRILPGGGEPAETAGIWQGAQLWCPIRVHLD